ncbi:MAG TPA: hypothetical protein VHE33_05360 [Acidobacteriaceae bacterium]|nr:hypothetical protein [Acidobacteriaceae bacterium]
MRADIRGAYLLRKARGPSHMHDIGRRLAFSVALLLPAASMTADGSGGPGSRVRMEVVRQCARPVLTIHSPGAGENKYGFEGGRVLKLGATYHLFTSEMTGEPHWVKMKLAHWTSTDRLHWQRVDTLFESSGDFTGRDPRAALWSPMPVFDPATNRWNLFYVAYAASPDTSKEWLTNHEGRIWRAVSERPGMEGINGPWKDAGIVLERGKDSDSWEGLQGTDSFFPYRVNDKWYAFYGSAHTESLPIALWQVGLAAASDLSGPWHRCTELNPLQVEKRFIENPIVTRLTHGGWIAVYDNHVLNEIGYTVSEDGIHWSAGQHLVVQSGDGVWATEVRTPLGLVEEKGQTFTLFYTANQKVAGAQTDGYGVNLTPGALGYAEVRLREGGQASGSLHGPLWNTNPRLHAAVTKVIEGRDLSGPSSKGGRYE